MSSSSSSARPRASTSSMAKPSWPDSPDWWRWPTAPCCPSMCSVSEIPAGAAWRRQSGSFRSWASWRSSAMCTGSRIFCSDPRNGWASSAAPVRPVTPCGPIWSAAQALPVWLLWVSPSLLCCLIRFGSSAAMQSPGRLSSWRYCLHFSRCFALSPGPSGWRCSRLYLWSDYFGWGFQTALPGAGLAGSSRSCRCWRWVRWY